MLKKRISEQIILVYTFCPYACFSLSGYVTFAVSCKFLNKRNLMTEVGSLLDECAFLHWMAVKSCYCRSGSF